MPVGTVRAGIVHEVRVGEVQAEILEIHVTLFPLDHAVAVIAENQNHDIQLQAYCGFQFLAVHHEAAVTHNGHDATVRVHHLGGHAGGQAGTHGREGIVQKDGVGFGGRIVTGKPDLVHAVIEGEDAVLGHDLANFIHQALRSDREAVIHNAFADVALQGIADAMKIGETPVLLGFQAFLELPQAVGNITDHFDLREVDRVHLGRVEVDMNDLGATGAHEERRFLNHIVAHVDDQVSLVDGAVHEIAGGQGGIAEEMRAGFVHHPFTHLGGDHRDTQLLDKLSQHLAGELAVGAGTGQQQRLARALDGFDGLADGLVFGNGAACHAGLGDRHGGMFTGDIFRQLQVRGAGALFLGQAEGFADAGGNGIATDHLFGELGQRAHHVDHINDLELALLAALDGLLSGDHYHGHGAQLGVGGGGHEVGGTGAKGGHADTGLAGETAIGGGHETGRLLMTGNHQFDFGAAQGLQQVQVFFAGNGKDVFNAFGFQGTDEQI